MTRKNIAPARIQAEAQPAAIQEKVEETPFEAVASICSVLVVGLFILTFLAQNFVIPSGSMEKTLLVGDHLVVDRITLAPPAKWMPLVRYREPQRGDVVVFLKPGYPDLFLVKRLIAVPGDHLQLRSGIVIRPSLTPSRLRLRITPIFSTSFHRSRRWRRLTRHPNHGPSIFRIT
jgi:signal peptidase I